MGTGPVATASALLSLPCLLSFCFPDGQPLLHSGKDSICELQLPNDNLTVVIIIMIIISVNGNVLLAGPRLSSLLTQYFESHGEPVEYVLLPYLGDE